MNVQRFWQKVQRCEHGETCPDCCWLWTSSMSSGYGRVGVYQGGRQQHLRAHRVSWMLTRGAIPPGLLILHNCPHGDNKACVNPQHLWLGTHTDNMRDALKKGQLPTGNRHGMCWRGTHNPWARLQEEQVLDIRYLSGHGMPYRLLSFIYGVQKSAIGHIVRGKKWTHLPIIVEER